MKRHAIRAGEWYETRQGIGQCTIAGGCFPWAAEVKIVAPMPIGSRLLKPGDFVRRLNQAEAARYTSDSDLAKASKSLGLGAPPRVLPFEPTNLTDMCICGHDLGTHEGIRRCSHASGPELRCACLGFKPADLYESKIRRTIRALLAELPHERRAPLLVELLTDERALDAGGAKVGA